MARTYIYRLEAYGISDDRQMLLRGFASQYHEWQRKLRDLYSLSSPPFDAPVQGGEQSNPTETKGLKASDLRRNIELIDSCLIEAAYGSKKAAEDLKRNVTLRQGEHSWGNITCGRATMYRYRVRFFVLLHHALEERGV